MAIGCLGVEHRVERFFPYLAMCVTCDYRGAVTVSSTGAKNQFQADDNGHVGRPCEVSLAPPHPELFASYGASAVTRTSGRGHVAEAKTNVIEVRGFSP